MSTTKVIPGCVDCKALGLAKLSTGRSARCKTHQAEYRRWYKRRWKHEQRNPQIPYAESEYHPVSPAVPGARVSPEIVESLGQVRGLLNEAVTSLVADIKVNRTDYNMQVARKIQEQLAESSTMLDRAISAMSRAK